MSHRKSTYRTVRSSIGLGGVVLGAMILSGGAAHAQAQANVGATQDQAYGKAVASDAKIASLEAAVHALEAQIAELKTSTATGFKQVRDTAAAAPKVTLNNARPQFETADGSFKIALRAVAQFDAAHYDVSPLTAANDLGSGTVIRRARIGFDGTAYKDWNFALWGVFGGTGGESAILNQAFVEYAGWRPFGKDVTIRLRAGAWATPAGLEDATSNTDMLFLERAAVAEMVRSLDAGDGRTGVGAFANGAHWYASAVLTGKVVGVPTTAEFNQQSGYVLRAAFNPIHGPDYDVHVGATLQGVLEPADTTAGPVKAQAIRLQERPESRVTGVRLVDTAAITANGATVYGLEAGASWRALYVAGEWFKYDVDRTAVGAAASPFNPSFSGWYVQGAYTLTGERRGWTSTSGGFKGIKPNKTFDLAKGTWGAWEVGARYSDLDLNDNAGSAGAAAPVGGIRGGEQKVTSLGLNWYPNSVVRFMLDYQWVKVERLNTAGLNIGEDVNTVSFRSQFSF